ncbi:FecR family protein [Ekhidna lutea]|uniref:FecR family protein n=1 Tax=Ekhidna lutea TaxID=447679 RepID=A0A239K273_EKHLU|nr:FecR domain-containing protein [Ekhidna lutea]SNT12477.1 FecR family protein [Ekhidna lutea]
MAKDLRVYNHLNYKDQPSEGEDKFVEFLFQHTEMDAPEIDESKAWNALTQKINNPNRSFAWMKIAAAVTILAILSVTVYLYEPTITEVHVASADEKVSVTFPDGSVGILNTNSSFSYPEKFGDSRNVTFEGEAYFDIVKSEKPFVIDVNGVDVKVLGTAFNLVTSKDEVKLYVDRGLVAFEKEGQQTQVSAGKEAIFNRSNGTVELKEMASLNIMAWRNGVFNFDDTPLNEALDELSEYYDVDFELSDDKLLSCRISATFKNQSLKEVLETIGTVLNIKTTIKNDIVKISGQGC